jgi:hypothetical protein
MATTEVRLCNSQDDVVEGNTRGVEMYPIPTSINLAINRLYIAKFKFNLNLHDMPFITTVEEGRLVRKE